MSLKKCSRCGVFKPVEDFNKCKESKTLLKCECRQCSKIAKKKYEDSHKAELRLHNQKYRDSHKAEARLYNQRYYNLHKAERRLSQQKYNDSHKAEKRLRNQKYRDSHKAERALYQHNHRHEIRAALARHYQFQKRASTVKFFQTLEAVSKLSKLTTNPKNENEHANQTPNL